MLNIKIIFILGGLVFLMACKEVNETDIHSKNNVNFEQVYWYAQRAKAAYDSPQLIKKNFPNTVRVASVGNTQVQYFIEHFPGKKLQVVSIRGTANFKNALEDAEYLKSENENLKIYVHRGFDKDASKLYMDLLPHLDKSQQVIVTGHSLGAAISTLIMMYLHEDGFELGPSINFGQPKVTNRKGTKAYDFLPLTRIVDKNDVVPLVPPITLLSSIHGVYEHLGKEVILLDSQYYVFLDEHDAERLSIGNFWLNIGEENIDDHFMDNYISSIKTKINSAQQIAYAQREKYTRSD